MKRPLIEIVYGYDEASNNVVDVGTYASALRDVVRDYYPNARVSTEQSDNYTTRAQVSSVTFHGEELDRGPLDRIERRLSDIGNEAWERACDVEQRGGGGAGEGVMADD